MHSTHPAYREVVLAAPPRTSRSIWGGVGLAIIVLLFTGFIASQFAPAITEPDDNGYFAQATRWVRDGQTWFKSASDAEYIGMHWLWDSKSDVYLSRYPPGLPALIAVLYALGGYKLAMLANPVLAVGALVGLYFTARRLTLAPFALAGVVLLATNPTFISHTLAGDAHMAVTFCLIWGTGLLLLWQTSRRGWQIFLAGVLLGCIPTIRYPDSLVALGVGAFLLCNLFRRADVRAFSSPHPNPLTEGKGTNNGRMLSHLSLAVLGALIPIIPLLIRNQLLLGGFWKTGYSLSNEQTGFSFEYFKQHAVQYLQIIQGDGLGIVFALGLLGITWMICARGTRALGAMLLLFVAPMLMLYMAYYWAPAGNSNATMRFLLPTFPIFILAGMWMLRAATQNAPRAARVTLPLILIGFQLLWGASTAMQNVDRMSFSKAALAMLTEKVRQVAQTDDVVVTTGAMLQHADFVRLWKVADMSYIRGGGGPGGFGGPGGGRRFGDGDDNAPSPMQAEKQDHLRTLYTGSSNEKLAKFATDVGQWSGSGKSIYIVCPETDLRATFGRDNADVSVINRIELPKRPAQPQQRGGFGGPGGGPPGMGGPGGGRGGPGGGGGGMFGAQNLDGTTWVIAKWTPAGG